MTLKTPKFIVLVGSLACLSTTGLLHAGDALAPADAASHVGEEATVCGVITGAKFSDHRNRQPTFLDFGPPHPDQEFTVLIWGADRAKFDYAPESLRGEKICVTGTITEFKGKPEIKVSEPSQIVRDM